MYNFLSLLIGILIAVMVAFNGELSGNVGNYSSLVVIHVIGYIVLVLLMFYKKIKIPFKMTLPLWLVRVSSRATFSLMMIASS